MSTAPSRLDHLRSLLAPRASPSRQTLKVLNLSLLQLTPTSEDGLEVEGENTQLFSFRPDRRPSALTPAKPTNSKHSPNPVFQLILHRHDGGNRHLWAAVYSLFSSYSTSQITLSVPSTTPYADSVRRYLIQTGLGKPLADLDHGDLLLSRAAFWQGAGAPSPSYWLNPVGQAFMQPGQFPFIPSFTRSKGVITAHPLRPPNPKAGDTVYRRWIPTINKDLTFKVIDVADDAQNAFIRQLCSSGKANSEWSRAGGGVGTLLEYLESRRCEPHVLMLMTFLGDELFGLVEVYWAREDRINSSAGCCQDYDRGLRLRVGDEQAQVYTSRQAWVASIVHLVFLLDHRTNRLIVEIDHEPSFVATTLTDAGFHVEKRLDQSHGSYMLAALTREKFFQYSPLF